MLNLRYILLILTAYFQLLYGQSIFHGVDFICDSKNNLRCAPDDNFICDADSICTLQCNDGCNGVIVNAKKSKSLSITNCINCDKMIIYCPQNGAYPDGNDNNCNLEISNHVNDVTIYAQESFYDFNLYQSSSDNFSYNILSSSIHCGDLSMIEFQCELNNDGNSCKHSNEICENYRIPTPSPTLQPTDISSSPTKTPTFKPSPTKTQKTNELDGTDSNKSIGLFSNTNNHNNMHYVLLVVGLCIIWGSFFCCFIIVYYHRSKKLELQKTVSIIERPMSPTFDPLNTSNPSSIKSPQKSPRHRYQFKTQTHTEVNKLYKVKDLSTFIEMNLNEQREEKEKEEKEDCDLIVVDVFPVLCPGQSPRYQLSPKNDFIRSPKISPRPSVYNFDNRPILADAHSNPLSIDTLEAVQIKLPSQTEELYDIKLDENDDVIINNQDEKKQSDIDDEGSLDSKYISPRYKKKKKDIRKEHDNNREQTEGSQAPPPPPPPTLINNSMNDNEAIQRIHGIKSDKSIISPSRHYRVKYSLGIQQDIKNCMVVKQKRFIFDDFDELRVSPNCLIKIPNSCYTPPPVPQLKYLAFQQNRPRIYSDPTHPIKQSK